ncbi:MAG: hypothetical protein JXR95_11555 [Deltaproteobacteria bacterium]|nr:hypothetical protein [Deltaproteobacteria bacterium]
MINHPESASEPKDGKKEKPKQVDVYTTSSCSWCVRVKDYFNKQGVRFKEINVENNPDAAQLMVRKTGQRGVPQISINGAWVVGFDKPKINALLGISGN